MTDSKKGEKKEGGLFRSLMIPTNPDYSFDLDPEEQHDYANPVTLNNKLVEYANAVTLVTAKLVSAQNQEAATKRQLHELEARIEDCEQDILSKYPPASADTKTLKVLAAYVRRKAQDDPDLAHSYIEMLGERAVLQRELGTLAARIDGAKQTFQLIKLLTDQVQTHLSFVKSEARTSKFHT